MARHIEKPAIIQAAGNKPKQIEEFIGRVNSGTADLSIARMHSPQGWVEPAQTPAFDEYTVVLAGALHIDTQLDHFVVRAGEAFIAEKGETVQYSTPEDGGAVYMAVCLPAFSPETVHRTDASSD